jgi:Ca-activated chloride channel family protein
MKEYLENIDFEKFHFLRTDYWWVGILVLVIWLFGMLFFTESNQWKKHIAKHLQPFVIQKGTTWKSRLIHVSVLVMFAFGLFAFFGPTWSQVKTPAKKVTSQMVIALDLSQSMMATDVSPSRLERAKFKIFDLLKANPIAETNLLVFAGSTHTAVPFTTDYKIITDQLDGLTPQMMPVKGTGFNALFHKIDTLFSTNQAQGKVLLVTDDLADLPMEVISSFLQENNVELYVFPFATPQGETIPKTKELSQLDQQKLAGLKMMERVKVVELTVDNSDVADLAKAVSMDIVFEDKTEEENEEWQDNGFWLVFPLAFLFLFSFRKGWALNMIVIAFGLSSCSSTDSSRKDEFTFQDLWFTQDYQAQKEFDNENYLEAAQQFTDPLHKGVAYFKAGNFLSAETAFSQDTSTTGLYNLGLTYAKLGKLDKAKIVFEKVLERDPNNTNAANNLGHITGAIAELGELAPEEVGLNTQKDRAQNERNKSPEDLSGGGQEATEKDMQKERLEETVETDQRKGKELDELPDDFESGNREVPKNILMRKVDDDPALFLTKKFKYQVKKKLVEVEKTAHPW